MYVYICTYNIHVFCSLCFVIFKPTGSTDKTSVQLLVCVHIFPSNRIEISFRLTQLSVKTVARIIIP